MVMYLKLIITKFREGRFVFKGHISSWKTYLTSGVKGVVFALGGKFIPGLKPPTPPAKDGNIISRMVKNNIPKPQELLQKVVFDSIRLRFSPENQNKIINPLSEEEISKRKAGI